MGKSQADPDAELDEHGLVVHKHYATVLVVLPPGGYDETTMRYARSSLYNVQVHTRAVSTQDEDLIHGHLQDELQADGLIEGEKMEGYAGVLFCGGPGAQELASHPECLRLAREAASQDKLIGAWGQSVAILGNADLVKKRKVTGAPGLKDALVRAGARYTGVQVQVDGKFVTALDDAAGLRFGKALVQVVAI